jgi:tetratricopeptide (TPR) repeat protein
MDAGNDKSANQQLRALLTLRPNLAEAHASLGLLLVQQGPAAYPAAVEQLNEASRLDPENLAALRGMAWLLIETAQQLPTAQTICQRILTLAPGDPLATRMLAVLTRTRAAG